MKTYFTAFFLAVLSGLGSPKLWAAAPVCDLTDCEGTVSLLGGNTIGGNTSLSATTSAATVSSGAAGVSTSTQVNTTLNVAAPPSMPTTPAAGFVNPVSSSTYFTLPNINANFEAPVTESNFPTTQSATTALSATGNQPSAPFKDPVKESTYYAVPTSGSTTVISTSITSITGSATSTGAGATP